MSVLTLKTQLRHCATFSFVILVDSYHFDILLGACCLLSKGKWRKINVNIRRYWPMKQEYRRMFTCFLRHFPLESKQQAPSKISPLGLAWHYQLKGCSGWLVHHPQASMPNSSGEQLIHYYTGWQNKMRTRQNCSQSVENKDIHMNIGVHIAE